MAPIAFIPPVSQSSDLLRTPSEPPPWLLVEIISASIVMLIVVVLMVSLLCKLYAVLTEGYYAINKDLKGKTIIVTGANTGIGKETAKTLAAKGARVILACRNMSKAEVARAEIVKETGNTNVCCKQLDLCSFRSVRQFAANINATENRLDVLINNAGLITPCELQYTEDGHEVSIQANHLGHFLLTHLLLDLLKKSGPGSRIVVVGSVGSWFGYASPQKLDFDSNTFPLLNYCSTKSFNMLFTVEMSKRLKDSGVTINCGHPGFVKSDFATGDSDGFQAYLFTLCLKAYGKTVKKGAMTTLYMATSDEVAEVSGQYFSDCKHGWCPPWASNSTRAAVLYDKSLKAVGLAFEDNVADAKYPTGNTDIINVVSL